MITTISPAAQSFQESVSSLKFGNRAKSVKNTAHVNEDKSNSAMLSSYQNEIKRLKLMLEDKTRAASGVDEIARLQEQTKLAKLEKTVRNIFKTRNMDLYTIAGDSRRISKTSARNRGRCTRKIPV